MRSANQIRQDFLDFFKAHGHRIVPSAAVIPHGDPTLLFTNAGMNQFKDVFLGQGERAYTRAADTQKCIRVSGKHNDLEEVGHDGYHHTFFEMLGNWSFGDYYKREAISWAWELLTEVWELPKDRLFVTVFRDDDEAADLWAEVTDIGSDRILRFDEKDNFWEMGDIGPCGPCSEIHYDATPDKSGRDLVNVGVAEVIEIWNLVFIQYDRQEDGTLEPLPSKHVDTGMGFERIVAVLQDCRSNYDTDIFAGILRAVEEATGAAYTADESGIPHQVIADHIRMLTMAMADGALPSNLGRGYVLRRVLRRAARFGRTLGMHEPFLFRLVPAVAATYEGVFPELSEQCPHIQRVIRAEEDSFGRTLDRGMQLFDEAVANLKPGDQIVGDVVFKLYDTYGFPADLTRQMAQERQLEIDEAGYEQQLAQQRERARAAAKFVMSSDDAGDWECLGEAEEGEFVGYDETETDAHILRYRMVADSDTGEERVQFVLDRSPFYGESGGQVGDVGSVTADGLRIEVLDTRKSEGQLLQIGRVVEGMLGTGPVHAKVDEARRADIQRNHTATHLLHQALRETLGTHVEQKGSLVAPERLRFDFSHYEAVSAADLDAVERRVNEVICRNLPLGISYRGLAEAKALGARALFGETYGEVVRLVEVGDYSRELCGGTHCNATGEIGLFKIVSEGSISAGIRRIEAVTGATALDYCNRQERLVRDVAEALRCRDAEVVDRVAALQKQLKELEKQNAELMQQAMAASAGNLLAEAKDVAGINVLAAKVSAPDVAALKTVAAEVREALGSGVVVLGAEVAGKAMFIAVVTPDVVSRGVNAGAIIRPVAAVTGGGGGGAPHIAQAGGRRPEKLDEALASVPELVRSALNG